MKPDPQRTPRAVPSPLPALVTLALALGGTPLPLIATAQDTADKGMQIAVEATAPLALTSESEREVYRVGEPMRFSVSGDRDFHLYVFSEDLDTGERRMLVPNVRERGNLVRGGRTVAVPGPEVTFFRDSPGVERITVIGSIEYIEVEVPDAKSLDATVDMRGGWPEALASKGVGKAAAAELPPGMAMVEIDVEVEADPAGMPSSENAETPLAFLSSSCVRCVAEERMRVGFGADRPGTVTVLVVDADGEQTELVSREVDGETLEYVDAVPEAPLGDHVLVALYADGAEKDIESAQAILAPPDAKGLRLAAEETSLPPHAIRRFAVVER